MPKIANSARQVEVDKTATWANSAAANTPNSITFNARDIAYEEYLLTVYNPSAVTDLTINVCNVENKLAGTSRDGVLQTITAQKGQTTSFIVHGIFIGGNTAKIVLLNNTALGTTDTFTATIRLKEVT